MKSAKVKGVLGFFFYSQYFTPSRGIVINFSEFIVDCYWLLTNDSPLPVKGEGDLILKNFRTKTCFFCGKPCLSIETRRLDSGGITSMYSSFINFTVIQGKTSESRPIILKCLSMACTVVLPVTGGELHMKR